jgi:hypothetical protein
MQVPKKYKTPLHRMKIKTFSNRIHNAMSSAPSSNLGFRIRQFLAGKLSAVARDGWITFTRL